MINTVQSSHSHMSTATSVSTERHAGFYYTPAGILNGEATPLEHLARGNAYNIVANGSRKQLESGTTVVNYCKSGDNFFAMVGIATGSYLDNVARQYWPAWANESSRVFEVIWVTKMVEVPSDYFVNQRQCLPLADVEVVANYVLRNNR